MNVFQNTIVMSEMNNESTPLLKRQNARLVSKEEIDFDDDGDEALYDFLDRILKEVELRESEIKKIQELINNK